MDIFWLLLLGHMVADFTCQTNYIAAWKRRSVWGLAAHVTTHPIVYIALLWPYLNDVWVDTRWLQLNGWACLGVIYVTHFLEDYWRIWSVMKHGAPDNLLFYLWDQAIHIVVLYALAPDKGPMIEKAWPVLGCLVVGVTHFATVTVYFIEKDLWGRGFPDDAEKYGGMLQRLAVFACLLLPGAWAFTAAAAVAGQKLVARVWPAAAPTRAGFAIGNGLALAGGLLGRYLWLRS
jgi:hypothetical protein